MFSKLRRKLGEGAAPINGNSARQKGTAPSFLISRNQLSTVIFSSRNTSWPRHFLSVNNFTFSTSSYLQSRLVGVSFLPRVFHIECQPYALWPLVNLAPFYNSVLRRWKFLQSHKTFQTFGTKIPENPKGLPYFLYQRVCHFFCTHAFMISFWYRSHFFWRSIKFFGRGGVE